MPSEKLDRDAKTVRRSPCFDIPLLDIFDDTLRRGLSLVLNVELNDKQWEQANLPVHVVLE